jgi:hypothetical protein
MILNGLRFDFVLHDRTKAAYLLCDGRARQRAGST